MLNGGLFRSLDFSSLSQNYASKSDIFEPSRAPERARRVRQELRSRPERTFVIVTHGHFLQTLVDGRLSYKWWPNTGVEVYTFKAEDDEDAELKQVVTMWPKDSLKNATSQAV